MKGALASVARGEPLIAGVNPELQKLLGSA
jgi:hypothetical protein